MQVRSAALVPMVFWGLLALYAGHVFTLPVIPSSDGPVHAYYGEILADRLIRSGVYDDFAIRQYLPPYALANYFLAFASMVFPGTVPEKLLFALCVIVFCAGFRALAKALARGETWAALLVFPFAYHRYLFHGFYNFCLGSGLVLIMAAFWIRNEGRLGGRNSIVYGLLLTGLYLAHPMALAAALLFVGLHTGFRILTDPVNCEGNVVNRLLVSLYEHRLQIAHVTCGLIPAYLVTTFMNPGSGEPIDAHFGLLVNAASQLWGMSTLMPHDVDFGWWARMLAALTAVLMGALGLFSSRSAGSREAIGIVLMFGVLFFLVFAIAPTSMNGSAFFGERFALFSITFVLALGSAFPLPKKHSWKLAAPLAILSLIAFADDASFHRRLAEMNRVLIEAPPIRPGSQGAILMEGGWGRWEVRGARYSPCAWAAATYFRRSQSTLHNTPWFWLSFWMLKTAEQRPYYNKELLHMTEHFEMGLEDPERVELPANLDVLIGAHCSDHEPERSVLERAAERYGLQWMPWSTREYVFFVRPEALAEPLAD